MGISLRLFRIGLYEEHLEEAAFLYSQCGTLAQRPDLAWTRLGDFEERLEAHLDALMVGGELALEVCQRRAQEGDEGELFAAVAVFCRHAEAPLLATVLQDLDYSDPKRVQAVCDALKAGLPQVWQEPCLRAIGRGQGTLLSLLGTVIGYRRIPGAEALLQPLTRAVAAEQSVLLWAVGRSRVRGAVEAAQSFTQAADPSVRAAALRTALRLQSPQAWSDLYALARAGQAPPVELGLAGERSVVPALVTRLDAPEVTGDVLMALGLLGDLSAVRPLVKMLPHESLGQAAAQALYVITGAPLFGDVQLPEQPDEQELFEHELQEYRRTGALPRRADGSPFGATVRQLSLDPQAWNAWLQTNAGGFSAELRYRLGRAYGPRLLLQGLVSEVYPKAYRGLAGEELLIRYGVDVALEVDMPVTRQMQLLRAAADRVAQIEQRVEPGRWYVAGRLV